MATRPIKKVTVHKTQPKSSPAKAIARKTNTSSTTASRFPKSGYTSNLYSRKKKKYFQSDDDNGVGFY